MIIKKIKPDNNVLAALGKIIYVFLLIILFHKNAYPVSSNNVFITDVTPVSFSVTWAVAESAVGSIEVFYDVLGSQPVSGISITQQYSDSSNTPLASAHP